MKLFFEPYTLTFRHPFAIASGTRSTTPVMLTAIEHNGIIGFGEASMPPYLGESHESAVRFLKRALSFIEKAADPMNIEQLMAGTDAIEEGNAAAKAAIDIALHDLKGKLLGRPCYSLFNIDPSKAPFSSFTIGIESDRSLLQQKVSESEGFRILKVKMGTDHDRTMMEVIRSCTDKPVSIDANQGWKDKHYALEMIHWLKELNVLFVEQPLPKSNLDDAAWLSAHSPLPVIADEAVQRIGDIEKVKDAYHGINIKLMKCTGMSEAGRMIARARELKMKVLIGCMSETSCAISAAAQLSPLADWADLDGAMLITNDPFDGVQFIDGQVTLNDRPGLGVVKRSMK
jgi:L-Ala-D/L-Glu epimerase